MATACLSIPASRRFCDNSMGTVQSVKNQYRGINAHLHSLLQTEGGWDSFHTIHIGHLTTALQAQLIPMGYEADIEQSLQIKRANEFLGTPISDISVFDSDPARQFEIPLGYSGDTHEIVMPIPTLLSLTEEEITYYKAVGLYQASSNREDRGKPVAWIELLPPSNKPTGRDFESYRDKRAKILHSGIVFIELDYLHQYPPTFDSLSNYAPRGKGQPPAFGSHPYRITVIDPRPDFFEGQGHSRQFDVDDLIPEMKILLNAGDVLEFDFNLPYQRTFEEMRYGRRVDYSQQPLNFELYSSDDQARILWRMLAVLKAAQQGDDLETGIPLIVEEGTLETAQRQFEQL